MDKGIKNLGSEVLLRATKDYCNLGKKQPKNMKEKKKIARERKEIISDLKGNWLNFLTDGMATIVAEQLIKNEEQIATRLKSDKGLN